MGNITGLGNSRVKPLVQAGIATLTGHVQLVKNDTILRHDHRSLTEESP